ncbi:hypothetical protein G6O69_31050 [Pseudenhygromyxa sp. WMMC2535]|uniref:hypothetical protein n=1 Tax=Pseudenhygromyxa sp. WMMC2535 TaxID=2712867 RepID=UPI0015528024|nr:hypothetical protein [Pseudenhygromyxa sp. WMMC2535]NVB42302.1 hypothetical protein [Pseudenhygromyxa sp. WMMC2535]
MAQRCDPGDNSCPHCGSALVQPSLARRRGPRWLGPRELLLAALGVGLLLGFGWVDDQSTCADLQRGENPAATAARDEALEHFIAARCAGEQCEAEHLGSKGCKAKLRLRETRSDAYGERQGTFDVTLGLDYSPNRERWTVERVLSERQVLGLP